MTLPDIKVVYPQDLNGPSWDAFLDAFATGVIDAPALNWRSRLEALTALSDALLKPEAALSVGVAPAGLAFLAGFLRPENLEKLLNRELPSLDMLEGFAKLDGRKSLRIVPRGVVCHWIAGNVPLLGMFSWALSALAGNHNIIRLSTRQDDMVSPMLTLLAEASDAGRQMAAQTAVLCFDRQEQSGHEKMSQLADVRIAWGGAEAVEAIRALPCSWECEDIVFGPRMSMAVVDPAAIDDKLLQRLATDIVYFDQLACSSPQHVYVKDRGDGEAAQFIDRLSAAFAKQAAANPRHELDHSETYQIALDRTRVLFGGGELQHDASTEWTVAVVDEPVADVQCANRFLQVLLFKQFDEIYPRIPRNIQTVITCLDTDDAEEFTGRGALRGVCRFPRPGEGNHFENPWDGMPILSRLTRWVMRTDAQ